MIKMSIEALIMWMIPFLIIPFAITTIRIILHIILSIMKGGELIEQKDTDINITEEKEQKLNIDKDLMKYFNYKEQKDV